MTTSIRKSWRRNWRSMAELTSEIAPKSPEASEATATLPAPTRAMRLWQFVFVAILVAFVGKNWACGEKP